MANDRRVHARTADGVEIVRYDRAGKWYAEPTDGNRRRQLRFADVIELATQEGSTTHLRLPGGEAFDRGVQRRQSQGSAATS